MRDVRVVGHTTLSCCRLRNKLERWVIEEVIQGNLLAQEFPNRR